MILPKEAITLHEEASYLSQNGCTLYGRWKFLQGTICSRTSSVSRNAVSRDVDGTVEVLQPICRAPYAARI